MYLLFTNFHYNYASSELSKLFFWTGGAATLVVHDFWGMQLQAPMQPSFFLLHVHTLRLYKTLEILPHLFCKFYYKSPGLWCKKYESATVEIWNVCYAIQLLKNKFFSLTLRFSRYCVFNPKKYENLIIFKGRRSETEAF